MNGTRFHRKYCDIMDFIFSWLLIITLIVMANVNAVLQNSVIPNLLVCMVSCGANAVLHYGLVYQADMGIK